MLEERLELQVTSYKLQVASCKIQERGLLWQVLLLRLPRALPGQATSYELHARYKLQVFGWLVLSQARGSYKLQVASCKLQVTRRDRAGEQERGAGPRPVEL